MTELIHDMAKAHWWRREGPHALGTYAVGFLMGVQDERSAVAAHHIDKAWQAVKDDEIAAMMRAVKAVNLIDIFCAYQDKAEAAVKWAYAEMDQIKREWPRWDRDYDVYRWPGGVYTSDKLGHQRIVNPRQSVARTHTRAA